jgi:hypothetical protein
MSIDFFIFARFFIFDQRLGLARDQCRGGKCALVAGTRSPAGLECIISNFHDCVNGNDDAVGSSAGHRLVPERGGQRELAASNTI